MKEVRASKPLNDSSRHIMSEAHQSQYADEVTTFFESELMLAVIARAGRRFAEMRLALTIRTAT